MALALSSSVSTARELLRPLSSAILITELLVPWKIKPFQAGNCADKILKQQTWGLVGWYAFIFI